MNQTTEENIELTIEKVAYGGKGIGFYKDKATFVPNTIEGDLVEAVLIKEHKNYCEAKVKKIKMKSPHRIKSPCVFSDTCGGCQWIDVKQEKQKQYKIESVKDSFERIGKTQLNFPIQFMESSQEEYYRNRILLRATFKEGSLKVGFFAQESHTQVHVDHCKIAHPVINELITYLSNKSFEKKRTQKLRIEVQVLPTLEAEKKKSLLITVHPIERRHELDPVLKALQIFPSTLWASYKSEQKKSPVVLFEESNSLKYYTKPGAFLQINTNSNHKLRELIKQKVKEKSIQKVLDLYCGSGNLSLSLSDSVERVLGIEDNKESIVVAQHNIKQNKLKNIKYMSQDASKFLKERSSQLKEFDCIILDPPRRGAKEDIKSLLSILPQFIFYVSCNPTTAARDYSLLKDFYEIKEIIAFNFFPQTYHIESFFILERKS